MPGRVHAAFGSIDIRYARSLPPDTGLSPVWHGTGWKGEHKDAQVVIWSTENAGDFTVSADPLYNRQGDTIDPSAIRIYPVGYVLTDAFLSGCGTRNKDTIPAHLVPDILFQNRRFNLPAHSSHPVWLEINIPHTAKARLYQGSVSIRTPEDSMRLPFTLRIQDIELPQPNNWHYHLDLWQNPFAIARYHQVTLWSQKHWDLIRKYLTLLANAGQKCITTSIIWQPWSAQTYDPFQSMITWIHNSNGQWDYDYSVFDHYVSVAMKCGITEQINCYTMVPWGNHFRYMDEDSSKFVTATLKPGIPAYETYWRPFLYDFREHLKEMGWLDKTCIALDERGEKDTKNLIRFIKKIAPEFKLALAGHCFKEIAPDIYDFSYNYHFLNNKFISRT